MAFLNPFVIRKYAALLLPPFFGAIAFAIGIQMFTFWMGLLFFALTIPITLIIGVLLLRNPFTIMLEGKGLLALVLDSTGVLNPFILKLRKPYVTGKIGGKQVDDIFDRDAVFYMNEPKKSVFDAEPLVEEGFEGGLILKFNKTELNDAKLGLYNYPCLIYNAQLGTFITKSFFSDLEKNIFAEHSVLYLNRKIEELSGTLRDFGRYIVEALKPKASGLFANKWVMIIIIIVVIILLALFAPAIMNAIGGLSKPGTSVLSNMQTPITPQG